MKEKRLLFKKMGVGFHDHNGFGQLRHLTQHQADGARSAPRVSGAILGESFRAKESVKPRSLCESLGFFDFY